MTELEREVYVLVSIAKLDAKLNGCSIELAALPDRIRKIENLIADKERSAKEAAEHIENMRKEHRKLETELADSNETVRRYKTQLMEVKTNKEYTAMLHEINHLEQSIDGKEERLLILMDELEQQSDENKEFSSQNEEVKKALHTEKMELESRIRELTAESKKLEAEKPKFLAELSPQVRKRYDRVMVKLSDFAVANVMDETCQGCFTHIPPQTAVEVRKNDRIITCETCGRILVFYSS
jgi:predicted  nucleic acid-binding Zn-ribbon protein